MKSDAVLDGDGEIVRAAPHVDVRRVMVEGVDVNQDALNDEYRTHAFECFIVRRVQRYEISVKHSAVSPTFLYILRQSGRRCIVLASSPSG